MSDPNPGAFRRAVVGVNGGPGDAALVRLTCEMARQPKSEVVVVHIVEIDWTHPIDAPIAATSSAAQQILDLAEGVAEAAHHPIETVLLQARDVGAALVDEASERGADLLVLSLPYRTRFGGDFAIGRTVPYCFKNAPCRVWVIREAPEVVA